MNERLSKEFKAGCALAPVAIPLGAVVVYGLLVVLMGSFSDAFVLIAASVICTLGISLTIWLPACYLAGYLLILAFRLVSKLFGQPSNETPGNSLQALSHKLDAVLAQEPELSNDQKALVDYIQKATAKGLSQEQIRHNLNNNGWATDSINWALNFVGGAGGV